MRTKFGITNTIVILAATALAIGLFLVDVLTPADFAGGIPYVAVIFCRYVPARSSTPFTLPSGLPS